MRKLPAKEKRKRAPQRDFSTLDLLCGPRSSFDEALCALLHYKHRTGIDGMTDGRRAKMVEALNFQATYGAIRYWRRGDRRAPAWAWELIRRKAAAQKADLDRSLTRAANLRPDQVR